jgi:hypothetical protein
MAYMANGHSQDLLDAKAVNGLLADIGADLARRGVIAEIAVYGGSALALIFGTRQATRDIDFISLAGAHSELMDVAEKLGRLRGLPDGWFNDAVGMFVSDQADYRFFGDYPSTGRTGLRVFLATPEYILAMKIRVKSGGHLRSSLEANDISDIWHFCEECGISDVASAEVLVARFYPDDVLPQRTRDILNDIFEARAAGKPYDPMLGW